MQAGSRAQAEDLMPGSCRSRCWASRLRRRCPTRPASRAIITAVQNGNMFRDMSGMAQTAALAQAALQASAAGATAVGEQAGQK